MPTDHRPKSQPGDTLEAAELNLLRETRPEVIDPRVTTYPHVGQVLSPIAPEEFARESSLWGKGGQVSFVGQIVPHGPEGEGQPDYEDSRYWVREIWESSPDDHPFNESPNWLIDPNEGLDPENNNPIRWVTAHNLAEINPADPAAENHEVAATSLDDGRLVKVDRILSQDGTPRFLFNAPTGGGGVAFAVIVERPGVTAKTLSIKWVRAKTGEGTFFFEKVGEPELVMIWPGQRGRHFRGLEVDRVTGPLMDADNVLPVHFVDGMWYVHQLLRLTTLAPSPLVNASDCQPQGALQ